MSFANAMAVLQKPFLNLTYGRDPRYRTINAVIAASRQNSEITVTDFGTDGKLRTVKVNYYPVDCDAEGSCTDNICDDAVAIQPKQRQFTLERCTASKVYALNREDIRKVGDNWTFSDHAFAQIRSGIDNVRKSLNSDLNAWFIANVGCQPDGQPTKAISLTDPNTAAIRPKGMFEIEKTFSDAGLNNPIIVGGGDVYIWEKGLTIGGINAQGQRIDQLAPGNVYYDKGLEDSFGDPTKGHIVAFSASALKFISWNANVGMFATDLKSITDLDQLYSEGGDYIFGSIVDPMTGLIWDLDILFDACTKQWKFQYKLNWDIFLMPESVCNLDCVNGIFHFTTCISAPVECPDVTPPTPVVASTYEWTPGDVLPLYIGDLTLAGQSSVPAATAATLAELAAILNDSVDGYTFSVSGSEIVYTGYFGISGTANDGNIVIEFEAATT